MLWGTLQQNHFFEDFSRNLFNDFKPNLIKTDIHETDNEYFVEAELPGIPKEDIQVTYELLTKTEF